MIENNRMYTILVKYVLFYFTIPRACNEDEEVSDVPLKDGLYTGKNHEE